MGEKKHESAFCLLMEVNGAEKLYSKPNSPVWLFVGAARKAPSPVMV